MRVSNSYLIRKKEYYLILAIYFYGSHNCVRYNNKLKLMISNNKSLFLNGADFFYNIRKGF
ncbi:hypothetical protein SAMN05216273_11826 [Chryseobacterium taihuense]|uniref:Uncharacterized protein n=1 Tax=Chryseobacterium taihuense TaxID=1141221 RepID=A0ABY0R0W0_9FLAO|nr:hypothetical protein SAMN05216273_11826 [Chryseobacterium taihuense]